MGSAVSSNQNEDDSYRVTVTNHVIQKVANPKAPPQEKKCSTQTYCKIEDTDIQSLQKIKDMDEANTNKFGITKNNFDESFTSFMKNNKEVIMLSDCPTFEKEREKLEEVFSGASFEDKKGVSSEYKAAVDDELKRISERKAKEFDRAKAAEAAAPKDVDPKKAKK